MARRGAAQHFWQTYAWSGGKRSAKANIYQYKNGQTIAGHPVDLNESYGGEGWWNLKPAEEQYPDGLSDFAKEAWKWVVEKKISDGTRPKDQVTREEVWTMLWRALK